ncbi:SOS response-associated peptidase family protein [Leucobacter sp. BZR 635]
MCAGYGLEMAGPNSASRSARSERTGLFRAIPPGDTPEGRALLEAWIAERHGRARITGRTAQNLNPLIRVRESERELTLGWWWLHVGGAPAKFSAFNSRADRLVSAWREPFQQRALLPASWYVEKGVRFALPDGDQFAMAAVTAPAAEGLDSYSLVTRGAVGGAAEVHDRMPLVLPRELHDEWLDPARAGDADLVRAVIALSEEISREMLPIGQDGGAGSGPAGAADSAAVEQPTLF